MARCAGDYDLGGSLKFSIITPTLQRPSLLACCESVNSQQAEWEHLVIIDSDSVNLALMNDCHHPNRHFHICGTHHNNGGNTCRNIAWGRATGDYVIYLDDDNYLADTRVLGDIALSLEISGSPAWAIFPITRLNSTFFSDPPRSCHTDTLNLVLRRDVAQWPDTTAYGSDGVLIESLKDLGIPYVAFPRHRPIGVVPTISFCK